MEQKVLRAGTAVIVCALLLRLLGGVGKTPELPTEVASLLIFLQTGRVVKPSQIEFAPQPEQSLPEETAPITQSVPVFSPDDAAGIQINSSFTYQADLQALIQKPLSWDLTGDEPTVLIVHTHGTESFAPTGAYEELSPYHTLDTDYNMVSVGAYVAQLLEDGGVHVVQDTTLHDTPSYNAAYTNSRESIQAYLKKHPSIRLVLDLHRDSFEDEEGNQIVQTVFSEGTALAPVMFVVGTDYGGLTHPAWQENLSLALKLQSLLEEICPGICRNINLRTQRFNQDLSPGTLLVEIGASGNSLQEALGAAEVLAQGILSLAHGSK